MSDKISIAMTTYNGGKYLRKQLDSLYAQTRIPNEIVVCDDHSKDNTAQILEEYHNKHGLRYFINETNLGVNKNFEKAIRNCTGDYIALSDQDDIWLKNKVEKSYLKLKEIENNNLPSLVTSERIDIDGKGRIITQRETFHDNDSYIMTLLGYKMQGCTFMMNRKLANLIIPLPKEKNAMFDTYIGMTAVMLGNKYDMGEPLMYYRHHTNNVFGQIKKSYTLKNTLQEKFIPYLQFYDKGRRQVLNLVQEKFEHLFIKERVDVFKRILKISTSNNLFTRIHGIFLIKEFSPEEKMTASLAVTISHLKNMIR